MVDLNMELPFNFYCFTDDEEGLLLPIKKKRVYDLPLHTYWWKMTVFDKTMWDNNEPTLYLDLDVIIQNDITYLFEKVNRELIRIGYTGHHKDDDKDELEKKEGLKYYTDVNSSIMLYHAQDMHFIYEKFIKNAEINMQEYYGMCRYLTHKHSYDMTYFRYWNDWYSAWKAYPVGKKTKNSPWQTMHTKEGKVTIMLHEESAICIMNASPEITSKQEQEVMDKVFSFYYG
tara:strand:- start:189 stop:878 length:690 start_codon:yes stop_codon:yes gene_type:complete